MKFPTTAKPPGVFLMVPYPAQGHVTPMLQLAAAMLRLGFRPVVVLPDFIHRKIAPKIDPNDGICCVSLPDGFDAADHAPPDFLAIEACMESTMPAHFGRLIEKFLEEEEEDGRVIACVVVDLLASWAIEVANQFPGVNVAGFWPAMLSTYRLIAAVPGMISSGIISDNGSPLLQGLVTTAAGQPLVNTEELPWLIGAPAARISRFKFWSRTLDRSRSIRWLLVNSFPDEESHNPKVENQNRHNIHLDLVVFPVGPLSLVGASPTKKMTLWEEDASCLEWLDQQSVGSVVYISFGSWVSPIGEGKIRTLALALEASRRPFLWVLGLSWREGLPAGYLERVSKLGKVVTWAPQMEILQHKAVGCYLTHCGWNSTMEAVQCRKPLLCWPVAGDQFLNCAYIVKEWGIGVRLRGFGERELEEGLSRVMMDDGKMKETMSRMKERVMGKDAISSMRINLTDFIDNLHNLRQG
ncbi:UDP-glycosyltransferase 82A1 [Diospyros lotus]|uniref:UDP-glycosyltransferase 82A1 n=1 Tax=Diospyros lotus TaxID=55363 RepID=UPI00225569D6|nr:UDP-glycosyltransferase 82A1 [Diospyros lotus]